MGEVSIKRKQQQQQHPSGSLEKNPLIYYGNGTRGRRCAAGIDDSDECEKGPQPGEQACHQASPV